MQHFSQTFDIRWSDLDPNFHVRHNVYYDWAATTRIIFLQHLGIGTDKLMQYSLGPILFREEAIFKREVHLSDKIAVSILLKKARRDYSRWSWTHEITKNGDTLAAIVNVDGAFMDTKLRKLTAPPADIAALFENVPRAEDFAWEEKS